MSRTVLVLALLGAAALAESERPFRVTGKTELFGYLPVQLNGEFSELLGLGLQAGHHLSGGRHQFLSGASLLF